MRRIWWSTAVGTLLGAACGGGSRGGSAVAISPMASSAQAAREFMKAAADSNVQRMGHLWGTAKGPAAVAGTPADWERIMVVVQAYLRGDSASVTSDLAVAGDDKRRRIGMALYRGTCVNQIPMTVLRLATGGWIVNSVDISAAGNPARPCEPGTDARKP